MSTTHKNQTEKRPEGRQRHWQAVTGYIIAVGFLFALMLFLAVLNGPAVM